MQCYQAVPLCSQCSHITTHLQPPIRKPSTTNSYSISSNPMYLLYFKVEVSFQVPSTTCLTITLSSSSLCQAYSSTRSRVRTWPMLSSSSSRECSLMRYSSWLAELGSKRALLDRLARKYLLMLLVNNRTLFLSTRLLGIIMVPMEAVVNNHFMLSITHIRRMLWGRVTSHQEG
jgi:hypothetical protein